MKPILLTSIFFLLIFGTRAQTNFIVSGDTWKYHTASDPGATWNTTGFNDASWSSGASQLGYGDGDEATVIPSGPSGNYYPTSYFRKTVSISNPSSFTNFSLRVKRDDGVVVYVNGTEVYRSNITGTPTYSSFASATASDDGANWQTATLATTSFVAGNNTIAVEVHQRSATSSDVTFDMELSGTIPGLPVLQRGPYLMMGSQTAVTIRWRTDVASDSKVTVGTVFGTYPIVVSDATSTTEHEIRITGLTAGTKYYYTIGTSTAVIEGGMTNFFTTQPANGYTGVVRIAAFGDCGRNDSGYQTQTLSAYQNYLSTNSIEAPHAWILLGDNAYTNGTDAEYTNQFFNPYKNNIMKNHLLYPAPGNHDYYTGGATTLSNPYYTHFSMPTNAECGGVASGTEAYYSFDIGDVHVLSLDSYGQDASASNKRIYDTTGAMVTWIKQDLAANTKKWVIAYWHHPPYTMGSHNSDSESDLVSIRQRFITILERYGVDMIICGHSHDYERSYLLKGYYGNEASFNASTHAVSNSSGKWDGTSNSCPYVTHGDHSNDGTVYVVAGSAGASGGTQSGYPHNAMPFSFNDGGMLYIEVNENRLDAKFIRRTGAISDNFTILKDVNQHSTVTINEGATVNLEASWPGSTPTYTWVNTTGTGGQASVSPLDTTTYFVRDQYNCLKDTFVVNVRDVTSPVINNCPGNQSLFTTSGICGTIANWTAPTATDNHLVSFNASHTSGTNFNLGSTTVSYTALDEAGNNANCSFTIQVNDNVAPVPNVATLSTINGTCSVTVSAPSATDNCGGTITGTTASPLTYTVPGNYTITWTYTDASGNSSTQTQQVVLADNIAPVPDNGNLPVVQGQCSATATAPSASDNCSGTLTATTSDPLSYSSPGNYTINWTYTDASGNTSTQTQQVIVADNTAPVPDQATLPTLSNDCQISVTAPTANDNCSGAITAATTDPLTYSTPGNYTITWTYTDASGNSSTQTQQVNVTDAIAPQFSNCPANIEVCEGSTVTFANLLATDNCATPSILQSAGLPSGTTYPVGTTTNFFVAEDENGNSTTCSFQVIVNALPVVTYIESTDSLCTSDPQIVLSSGNPNGGTYTGNGVTGNAFDPSLAGTGNISITYSFTDANGCNASANDIIVVSDCSMNGVEDLASSQYQLYPNPTSGMMTLSKTGNGAIDAGCIKVYNNTGALVETRMSSGKDGVIINTESLCAGVYYLILDCGTEQKKFRFVKK
jgi:hypothetical protein